MASQHTPLGDMITVDTEEEYNELRKEDERYSSPIIDYIELSSGSEHEIYLDTTSESSGSVSDDTERETLNMLLMTVDGSTDNQNLPEPNEGAECDVDCFQNEVENYTSDTQNTYRPSCSDKAETYDERCQDEVQIYNKADTDVFNMLLTEEDELEFDKVQNYCSDKADVTDEEVSDLLLHVIDANEDINKVSRTTEVPNLLLITTANTTCSPTKQNPNVLFESTFENNCELFLVSECETSDHYSSEVRECVTANEPCETVLLDLSSEDDNEVDAIFNYNNNVSLLEPKPTNIDLCKHTCMMIESVDQAGDWEFTKNESSTLYTKRNEKHVTEISVNNVTSPLSESIPDTAVSITSEELPYSDSEDSASDYKSEPEKRLKSRIQYPEEKSDIEDPRWIMFKANNEDLHSKIVAMWNSKDFYNPRVNLTVHNFRKRRLLKEQKPETKVTTKRKASDDIPDIHPRKLRKTYSATFLQDMETEKLETELKNIQAEIISEHQKKTLEIESRYEHYKSNLENCLQNKYMSYCDLKSKKSEFEEVLNRELSRMRQCVYLGIEKIDRAKEDALRCLRRHYSDKILDVRIEKEEIEGVNELYKNLGEDYDPTVLTEGEASTFKMLNMVLQSFPSIYKTNQQ